MNAPDTKHVWHVVTSSRVALAVYGAALEAEADAKAVAVKQETGIYAWVEQVIGARPSVGQKLPVRLFYPCIADPLTGRIDKRCTRGPLTFADGRAYLEKYHREAWIAADTCLQPLPLVLEAPEVKA